MFPTCSNRLLAGRNALSATDLTIVSSGPRGGPAAGARNIFDGTRSPPPPTVTASDRRILAGRPQVRPGRRHRPRWYVARALGEETAIRDRPLPASRGASIASPCAERVRGRGAARGGVRRRQASRQDANEPSGDFPVEVDRPKFPTDQRLAETSDLLLGVKNTGDEQLPDLAVTIYTGDEKAERLLHGPLRPARPRQPQPPGLDPRERTTRVPSPARTRRPRSGAAGRRRGGADQHLRLRPARPR